MSDDIQAQKAAGIALITTPSGRMQGMVISEMDPVENFLGVHYDPVVKEYVIQELRKYADRNELGEIVHRFAGKESPSGLARAKKWIAAYRKKAKKSLRQLVNAAAAPIATSQIPVLEKAWLEANRTSWPNLHKAQVEGTDIETAIKIDLAAMGFDDVKVPLTNEVAKAFLGTTICEPDKLDSWLVANWFHGEKLVSRVPKERLRIAKAQGHSATEKSLGMRLTRLSLTSRKLRE
jgi:hypothetical protein